MAIRAAVFTAKRWLPLVEPAVGLWIRRIGKNKDIVLEVERTPNCLKDLPGKLTAKRCLGQDELLSWVNPASFPPLSLFAVAVAPPSKAPLKRQVLRLPTKVPILEPNSTSRSKRFPLRHRKRLRKHGAVRKAISYQYGGNYSTSPADPVHRGLCLGPAYGGDCAC